MACTAAVTPGVAAASGSAVDSAAGGASLVGELLVVNGGGAATPVVDVVVAAAAAATAAAGTCLVWIDAATPVGAAASVGANVVAATAGTCLVWVFLLLGIATRCGVAFHRSLVHLASRSPMLIVSEPAGAATGCQLPSGNRASSPPPVSFPWLSDDTAGGETTPSSSREGASPAEVQSGSSRWSRVKQS